MMQLRLLIVFLLVCVPTLVQAQAAKRSANSNEQKSEKKKQPGKASNEQDGLPDSNLEDSLAWQKQQAVDALELLEKQVKDIEGQEQRIRMQALVADALWTHDPKKARQLFIDTFQEIASATFNSQRSYGNSRGKQDTQVIKSKLRQHVLHLLSRHDAERADELAKTVGKEKDQSGELQEEQAVNNLRLLLAADIADSKPEMAAAIAVDTLKSGVSPLLIRVLLAIRRKNTDVADDAYLKAITVARGSEAFYNYDVLLLLGLYVAEDERGVRIASRGPTEQFLRFAYSVAAHQIEAQLAGSSAPSEGLENGYWILQKLVPLFEQYLPEQAAAMRAAFKQLSERVSPSLLSSLPEDSEAPSSVQAMLKSADEAPTLDGKDKMFTRAAMLAARQGDFEQALFITTKLHSYEDRNMVESLVLHMAADKEIATGNTSAAYKYASGISCPQNRWKSFIGLANWALSKKDISGATGYLLDIQNYISGSHDSDAERALGYFSIAEVFVRFDLPRGLQAASLGVKALNSANFDKKPEKRSKFSPPFPTIESFNFEPVFASLSRDNFQAALDLARAIDKKVASVAAQIAVCSATLDELKRKSRRLDGKGEGK